MDGVAITLSIDGCSRSGVSSRSSTESSWMFDRGFRVDYKVSAIFTLR